MLDQLLETGRPSARPMRFAAVSLTIHAAAIALVLVRPARPSLRPIVLPSQPTEFVYLAEPSRTPAATLAHEVPLPIIGPPSLPQLDPGVFAETTVEVPAFVPVSRLGDGRTLAPALPTVTPPWRLPPAAVTDPSIIPPEPVGECAPIYPTALAARGTEGKGIFEFVVDRSGRWVDSSLQVVSVDDPGLVEAWREALRECRFRPALRGGAPVAAKVRQTVRFRLYAGRP